MTTCDGIASALKIFECFLSHLYPSVDEGRVIPCLKLHQLTLEEHLVIRVTEVYPSIIRWYMLLHSHPRSSICALIPIEIDIEVFNNTLGFSTTSLQTSL